MTGARLERERKHVQAPVLHQEYRENEVSADIMKGLLRVLRTNLTFFKRWFLSFILILSSHNCKILSKVKNRRSV